MKMRKEESIKHINERRGNILKGYSKKPMKNTISSDFEIKGNNMTKKKNTINFFIANFFS